MNIFQRILQRDHRRMIALGIPSKTMANADYRFQEMASLNPNGFRKEKRPTRTNAAGKTRGQMKREARRAANSRVSEDRPAIYMHSHARLFSQLAARISQNTPNAAA